MADDWQLALNHMAIIKGQLTIYGELPGTLAERTGEVAEKEVFLIDKDYTKICLENKNLTAEPFGAICNIQRKGRVMKQFFYTIDQARKAGQYPPKRRDGSINDDSPWHKYTHTMLLRKAMSLGVKFEFPEALVGVAIAEFEHDLAPDLREVSPAQNAVAEELNSVYLEKDTEPGTTTEGAQ